jgi:hypothetical protein
MTRLLTRREVRQRLELKKGSLAGGPFSLRSCAGASRCFWALLLATVAGGTCAQALEGSRQVVMHASDGSRLLIGQVQFTPQGDGSSRFALKLDHTGFTDHFLSMREFKCLPGGTEITCYVPYPYPHPATVAPGQFAWLEHALLFMFKKPSDFGAKLWNGVYFELRADGNRLLGTPQAVDLNQISAPPARLDVPPLRKALRDDMPAGARWFVRLTIE